MKHGEETEPRVKVKVDLDLCAGPRPLATSCRPTCSPPTTSATVTPAVHRVERRAAEQALSAPINCPERARFPLEAARFAATAHCDYERRSSSAASMRVIVAGAASGIGCGESSVEILATLVADSTHSTLLSRSPRALGHFTPGRTCAEAGADRRRGRPVRHRPSNSLFKTVRGTHPDTFPRSET